MKILMLWYFYEKELSIFYERYPFALNESFAEHRKKLLKSGLGWPADLSSYMNKKEIETEFMLANAEHLQKKWAQENNYKIASPKNWEHEIALEQIKRFKPDILWIAALSHFGEFATQALQHTQKIIAWVGSPFTDNVDVSGISVLLTENPRTLQPLQHHFKKVIVTKPGFDHELLNKVGKQEKKFDITFVGSLTPAHSKRIDHLIYLLENGINIKIFSDIRFTPKLSFFKTLKAALGDIVKRRSPLKAFKTLKKNLWTSSIEKKLRKIKKVCKPAVFGLDMYKTLAQSKMTLNVHIDCAGDNAGNMRLFEATGMGACTLTENAKNIKELFVPDKELIVYNSKKELLNIIKKLLKQEEKIQTIAQIGQQKTLKTHSMERMFGDVKQAFE